MKNFLFASLFAIFCIIILAVSLRGLPGNPTAERLDTPVWKDNGPLELSPERGRYALTYSYLEDNSVHFELPIARFATPDVGYHNEKYVSLFAPGVSFLAMPGYLIGKYFNLAQVGTFAVTAIFACINALLLRSIAMRLGASGIAATLGATVFLFASPAFAYAVSLYQHHISTFLILSSIYILLRWNSVFSLTFIWLLCAASIPVDYPNLILMFPIGVAAILKMAGVKKSDGKITIDLKVLAPLTFAGAVLPLLFFVWFNTASYNNPLQFSGTVASARVIDENGKPAKPASDDVLLEGNTSLPEEDKKSAIGFFQTRNLVNGMVTHIFSKDRGTVWFTPVMFLAVLGGMIMYRKNRKMLAVLTGIIGANFVLYSLWGDPYGGWAFGSRYLIPAYSIASILIALAITKYNKSISFTLLFLFLFIYSAGVNTLGAVTSSRNPPQVEIAGIEKLSGREEKYSYDRNFEFLETTGSKSFVYQTFAHKYVDAELFYILIAGVIGSVGTALVITDIVRKKEVTW